MPRPKKETISKLLFENEHRQARVTYLRSLKGEERKKWAGNFRTFFALAREGKIPRKSVSILLDHPAPFRFASKVLLDYIEGKYERKKVKPETPVKREKLTTQLDSVFKEIGALSPVVIETIKESRKIYRVGSSGYFTGTYLSGLGDLWVCIFKRDKKGEIDSDNFYAMKVNQPSRTLKIDKSNIISFSRELSARLKQQKEITDVFKLKNEIEGNRKTRSVKGGKREIEISLGNTEYTCRYQMKGQYEVNKTSVTYFDGKAWVKPVPYIAEMLAEEIYEQIKRQRKEGF